MAKQVSDLIVERLIEWGVDTIFGFPGDGVDGFFESLRTHQEKLRFIQVRHEEAAAFAAVGYAKYTGRLGVCCATSGPGGSSPVEWPLRRQVRRQPVLAITGHTFHDLIGMDYQQDVDLDKLYMDVSGFQRACDGSGARRERGRHGGAHRLWTKRRRAHLHPEGHSGVAGLGQDAQQRKRQRTTAATGRPLHCQALR